MNGLIGFLLICVAITFFVTFVMGDKFTAEQIEALQMLKNEGLYLGKIPRMEV